MAETEPIVNPEKWLEDHGDILFRYAVSRVKDPAIAEDMVQETFLAAIKAQERFSGRSTERTWLVGILKHKIVDYIRKASREQTYEDMQIPANQLETISEQYFDRKGHWKVSPPDWQVHPRKSFEQGEFRQVLDNCLEALPERLRAVFTLRELEGLDADEICKILDISATNLWVMLYRARMKLKSCLEQNWLGRNDPQAD